MVEQNSRHADSYWYSIEHPTSLLAMFNLLFGTEKPPFVDDIPGVCHADELIYLFDANFPILLCDRKKFFGESLYNVLKKISLICKLVCSHRDFFFRCHGWSPGDLWSHHPHKLPHRSRGTFQDNVWTMPGCRSQWRRTGIASISFQNLSAQFNETHESKLKLRTYSISRSGQREWFGRGQTLQHMGEPLNFEKLFFWERMYVYELSFHKTV